MSDSKMTKDETRKHTCCFFGHRKIKQSAELKDKIYEYTERLIVDKDISTFLFGSKSEFDDVCYEVVSELKEKYPHIQRIYVRAEIPYINDDYRNYLLENFEDTYFPEFAVNAGKASYVERNQEMINKSSFCIVYYDKGYLPPRRRNSKRDLLDYQPKSGTKLAYDYARRKDVEIINIFDK